MTEPEQASAITPPRSRRRWASRGIAVFLALLSVGVAALFSALLSGPVDLPRPVVRFIEERATAAIAPARMRLGGAALRLEGTEGLTVVLSDVVLRDAGGAILGQLTRARAEVSAPALLAGRLRPIALGVDGAQLTMRRDAEGAFSLDFGGSGAGPRSAAEAIGALRGALALPLLEEAREITGADLTITLEDVRAGRVWQATGGRFTARKASGRVELDVFSEVFNGTETLARLQSSVSVPVNEGPATLAVTLADAAARDLALQAPVLSYLSVLDAPVSGAIRADIDPGGALLGLAATLEIGAGTLAPGGAAAPVEFNRARAYMTYDPARSRIEFDELSVESDALRVMTEGHAYLTDMEGGWPTTLVAQVRLSDLEFAPEGMFTAPLSFPEGRADLRVRLDPFGVTFGQAVLGEGAEALHARARLAAGPEGWTIATDLATAGATPERVLGLWPLDAARGTRDWLSRNLLGGNLSDVSLALRFRPGAEEPEIGASFSFSDARVRFLPQMPAIEGGVGHAALTGPRFALAMRAGRVAAPGLPPLDLGGSSFVVADVFEKRATGEVRLSARGGVGAAMAILDNRPLELLSKAGRPADFVQGRAEAVARIEVPLLKEVDAEDVGFEVAARLSDVFSDQIVAGRPLTAETLSLSAVPEGLTIEGRVRVGDIPAEIVLDQPFAAGATAELRAAVEVGEAVLGALGVALPQGSLSGRTRAEVTVDLPPDAPPGFRMSADLAPLRLSFPALGWEKPEGTEGRLELLGRLGRPVVIDRIAVEAAGLSAEGRLLLTEEGGFAGAEFDLVRLGDWLEAPVTIAPGAGGGPPRLSIGGGRVDLRRRPAGGTGGGAGQPVPMDVRLDRLVVNDAISLTGVRAEIRSGRALEGRFRGQMNGGAEVAGDLIPQPSGTALRIRGSNAGAVLRDAGLFRSLDGGRFEVVMVPLAEGGTDGQLQIVDARLRDQPVLADLLDAVSIVGIIDQMRGPGIQFDLIDGRFRLEGDRLILEQSSATGASLGVSLDGVYDTRTKQLDMGGVISPVYLLNSIGQIFTRRGEGLFGFTFRLTGDAESPRMAVNPLSILTPGMFREIFRRAPPERQ